MVKILKTIEIGFKSEFVEQKLIPILLIRSKLGGAHTSTAPLSIEDKEIIYKFTNSAFNNVQFALNFIFEKLKQNQFHLEPVSSEVDREQRNIIDSLKTYLEKPDQCPL